MISILASFVICYLSGAARNGTKGIHACRNTNTGAVIRRTSRHVSLKQEKFKGDIRKDVFALEAHGSSARAWVVHLTNINKMIAAKRNTNIYSKAVSNSSSSVDKKRLMSKTTIMASRLVWYVVIWLLIPSIMTLWF